MWDRFLKAMEYRGYCRAIQILRMQGLHEEASRIIQHKKTMYKTI